jgi:hypothetical protein
MCNVGVRFLVFCTERVGNVRHECRDSGGAMKRYLFCVLFAILSSASAAEPEGVAKQEIEHLIAHLASSGCQFNRNGSWYSASKAVSHLNRKYEYLAERKLVPTAEAFIENAASESSSSGKPYLVKCKGQQELNSADWFRTELQKFREQSTTAAKKTE